MEQKYSLIQVIGMLKVHPNLVFSRINDFRFKIYSGKMGDLLFRIDAESKEFRIKDRVLPIFNYMQDYFVISEVEK